MADQLLGRRQLELVEERERPRHRQPRELVDRLVADRDGEHLRLEPRAVADGAGPEAHVLLDPLALLRRVGLAVAALERGDDPLEGHRVLAPAHPVAVLDVELVAVGAVEEELLLLGREVAPGRVDVDLVAVGDRLDDRVVEAELPTDQGTSAPSAIETLGSGTSRSGSISSCAPRPVQRGQAPCGELKEKIRGCSSGSETPCSGQANFSLKSMVSPSTTSTATSPSASAAAVSTDCVSRWRRSGLSTSRSTTTSIVCLNFLSSTISSSSRRCSPSTLTRVKPSRAELLEHVAELALAVAHDRRVDREARPLGQRQDLLDDLVEALAGDRAAADGAVRPADARVEQAQVVVDLGDGADGRARVARGRLLVDRDRRREPVDRVDVGLLHHLQELARVRGEALDVAALALGVDRVEGERRLAGAREPGDADEAFRGSRTSTSLRLCSRAPWTISQALRQRPKIEAAEGEAEAEGADRERADCDRLPRHREPVPASERLLLLGRQRLAAPLLAQRAARSEAEIEVVEDLGGVVPCSVSEPGSAMVGLYSLLRS